MAVNVFIKDLPIKVTPLTDGDKFIVQRDNTEIVDLSSLRNAFIGTAQTSFSATNIFATTFTAETANFSVIDVKQYELSGFRSSGSVFVSGSLTVTDDILTDKTGRSTNWNSVYTTARAGSANWSNVYTTVRTNSSTQVKSDVSLETPSTNLSAIDNIIVLTQANYDALSVKRPTTYYIIV